MALDQNFNDTRRSMVAQLEEQSSALLLQGRPAEAVPSQERAVALINAIVAAHGSATTDDLMMLGSLRYGLGSSLRAVNRPDDALASLDQADKIYSFLLDQGRTDMRQRITDVRVRRARALHEMGRVTEATLAIGEAILLVTSSEPAGDQFEFQLGLARLLFTNSLILQTYGDPDLIVRSADTVVRIIMSNGARVNALDDSDYYIDLLRDAATRAMREHAQQGRAEIAAAAGKIAVDTWTEPLREQFPTLMREVRQLGAGYRASIIRAAATYGKLTGELGQQEVSERYRDFARGLDPGAAAAIESWWPGIGVGRMTLRVALLRARELLGAGGVPDAVLLLSGGENTFTTLQRCPQPQWADSAGALARIVARLDGHPQLGAVIGMESHLLFAASETPSPPQLVNGLIATFAEAGDQTIGQDLRRWAR